MTGDDLLGIGACRLVQHLGGACGLGQRVRLGGHEARARSVVNRHVGRHGDGLGRCQFAVLLQHARIGQLAHRVSQRLRLQQRVHQMVAAAEQRPAGFVGQQLGHNVRVQAILRRHASIHQRLPVQVLAIGHAIHVAQAAQVKPPGAQLLQVDRLLARAHLAIGVGPVVMHAVLVVADQLGTDLFFQLLQIGFAVLVRREVALFHQALGHGIGRQPALGAEHRGAEHAGLDAEVVLVHAQMLSSRRARNAAQLGNGGQQRIDFRVQRRSGLGRRRRLREPIFLGDLARQEGPGPVHRLVHQLAPRLHLSLLAQRRRFTLQARHFAPARVRQPLHVAQAACLQILLGVLRGLSVLLLVFSPFGLRHAYLLGSLKRRHHPARLLGHHDFVGGRQHAIHHAAHVSGQFDIQVLEVAVDIHQPGAETLKQPLQFDAGRLALVQIRLEPAREGFVVRAPLLERHVLPLGDVAHAKPLE